MATGDDQVDGTGKKVAAAVARGSLIGRLAATGAVLVALSSATACTPDGEVPPSAASSAPDAAHLSMVVYGPAPVTRAWKQIVDAFESAHQPTKVDVETYPDEAAALAAVRSDAVEGRAPDLFLSGIDALPSLMDEKLIQPVSDLLEDRQVDFGDGYVRSAVEEYSRDNALQCMPVTYSPLVVYYNPALVDLTAAQGDAQTPITTSRRWTMDQFAMAVRSAAGVGRKGIYIQPDLDQVGPFLATSGGGVVDNTEQPTTLTLASDGSIQGLTSLLSLVGDRRVALSSSTPRATAVRNFERGKLAMILGYRDLTGELRAHAKVPFNVLPMPRVGGAATSGQSTGMCLSRASGDANAAADLLADLVSVPAMRTLARTGWAMPTNLAVIASNAFWQPAKMPSSAAVFTDQVRNVTATPVAPAWPRVAGYANARLRSIMASSSTTPDVAILTARMQLVDTVSQRMLAPPSPSSSPSASPSTQE